MAAALRSDWVEERRCRPAMRIGTEQETQRAAAGQESQAEIRTKKTLGARVDSPYPQVPGRCDGRKEFAARRPARTAPQPTGANALS